MSAVMIVDGSPSVRRLGNGIAAAGFDVRYAGSLAAARARLGDAPPPSLVVELAQRDGCARAFIEEVLTSWPRARIVVTALHSSIGSAIALLRLGVVDYLPKPVTVPRLLAALGAPAQAQRDAEWLTLDRACIDYIEDVLAACGTIAQTARVLGLDRRSLRRMLERRRAVVSCEPALDRTGT
jgi:ActR/RegA family two-component response regulator